MRDGGGSLRGPPRSEARQRETEGEEYLVGLAPKPVFNPSIRALPSPRSDKETGTETEKEKAGERLEQKSAAAASNPTKINSPGGAAALAGSAGTGAPGGAPAASSPSILEPALPELFNFRFCAGKVFKDRFERLAEVLGFENPVRDMAEIFDLAVDVALEKKDPMRKRRRRLERELKRGAAASAPKSSPGEIFPEINKERDGTADHLRVEGDAGGGAVTAGRAAAGTVEPAAPAPANSHAVPDAVRERVLERAGYRCEYRAPDGTRCSSRTGLQVEHSKPFAIFRSHDEKHLLAYCWRHNRLSAESVYGAEFIRQKIEERRGRGDIEE